MFFLILLFILTICMIYDIYSPPLARACALFNFIIIFLCHSIYFSFQNLLPIFSINLSIYLSLYLYILISFQAGIYLLCWASSTSFSGRPTSGSCTRKPGGSSQTPVSPEWSVSTSTLDVVHKCLPKHRVLHIFVESALKN